MTTPRSAAASEGPIHRAFAGIEARLQAAFPPQVFQHEVLPAPLTRETLGRLSSARAPFVGLCLLGLQPAAESGRAARIRLRFGVYLLVRNSRTRERALGDRLGFGLAQMVHAAIVGLHGWTIGGEGRGGVGTLAVREGDTLDGNAWADNDAACASLTVEADAEFGAALPADALKTLAAAWELRGDAVPPDPAAAPPAATDTIALEGIVLQP